MWIDDEPLLAKLKELAAACVVVRKQGRRQTDAPNLARLEEFNEQATGLPRGIPQSGRARAQGRRRLGGSRPVLQLRRSRAAHGRTLGYRRRGGPLVPSLHAKLALLGGCG